MKTPRTLGVIGAAIVASPLAAQPIVDDFEAATPGTFPGVLWEDMLDRAVNTASDPTMLVIDTIGPDGSPTRALQTVRAHGTNGFFRDVSPAEIHELTMDVRIDAIPTAGTGWPVGLGFVRYSGTGDINANPQIVLYSWTTRHWNFFIAPMEGRPALDLRMSGPRYTVGRWYTAYVRLNSQTGQIDAEIRDAVSGDVLNSIAHQYAGWDAALDQFDSVVFFDGDGMNTAAQGQATVDNIVYTTSSICAADFVMDGELNFFDVAFFLGAFNAQNPAADFNADGAFDFFDVSAFLQAYNAGCP
ncbi:MAG: hypothetical protein JJ916_11330 [Phycisphaerales bacterium]|nr:hypothetical protein [Phycisphaerales bacterium]